MESAMDDSKFERDRKHQVGLPADYTPVKEFYDIEEKQKQAKKLMDDLISAVNNLSEDYLKGEKELVEEVAELEKEN